MSLKERGKISHERKDRKKCGLIEKVQIGRKKIGPSAMKQDSLVDLIFCDINGIDVLISHPFILQLLVWNMNALAISLKLH